MQDAKNNGGACWCWRSGGSETEPICGAPGVKRICSMCPKCIEADKVDPGGGG
jgi:hypothetical protein